MVLLCELERVDSEQEKMSFTRRAVKVPPNSASLEEARHRVIDFFKTVCRSIPTIIDIYNLDEVATVSELRSSAAAQIRKNSHITNTKVKLLFSLSLSSFPDLSRLFVNIIVNLANVIDKWLFGN